MKRKRRAHKNPFATKRRRVHGRFAKNPRRHRRARRNPTLEQAIKLERSWEKRGLSPWRIKQLKAKVLKKLDSPLHKKIVKRKLKSGVWSKRHVAGVKAAMTRAKNRRRRTRTTAPRRTRRRTPRVSRITVRHAARRARRSGMPRRRSRRRGYVFTRARRAALARARAARRHGRGRRIRHVRYTRRKAVRRYHTFVRRTRRPRKGSAARRLYNTRKYRLQVHAFGPASGRRYANQMHMKNPLSILKGFLSGVKTAVPYVGGIIGSRLLTDVLATKVPGLNTLGKGGQTVTSAIVAVGAAFAAVKVPMLRKYGTGLAVGATTNFILTALAEFVPQVGHYLPGYTAPKAAPGSTTTQQQAPQGDYEAVSDYERVGDYEQVGAFYEETAGCGALGCGGTALVPHAAGLEVDAYTGVFAGGFGS